MQFNLSQNKSKVKMIKEKFTGKNLTIFGGVGLIKRWLEKIKLVSLLQMIDIRKERNKEYCVIDMLLSIIYGMMLGLFRPYHMAMLKHDRVFQSIVNLKNFPSQSTISRFLSKVRVKLSSEILTINKILLLRIRKRFEEYISGVTLDLDSHVTVVYGNQQRASVGYNPKKRGRKSYHPMLCFIGETRDYVAGVLRSGNHHTSYGWRSLLYSAIKIIGIKVKRLRADSGFFSLELMLWATKRKIQYFIVVPMHHWVQKLISHQGEWKKIDKNLQIKDLKVELKKDLTVRIITVKKLVDKGKERKKNLWLFQWDDAIYDYQSIATNSEMDAMEVWQFYNKRATCENFIKEGIYSFGLDKIVSCNWAGNNSWFQLVMLCYNIFNWFKEYAMNQKITKNFASNIRRKLFIIPAKLVNQARKYVLKLERNWPYKHEYILASLKL